MALGFFLLFRVVPRSYHAREELTGLVPSFSHFSRLQRTRSRSRSSHAFSGPHASLPNPLL